MNMDEDEMLQAAIAASLADAEANEKRRRPEPKCYDDEDAGSDDQEDAGSTDDDLEQDSSEHSNELEDLEEAEDDEDEDFGDTYGDFDDIEKAHDGPPFECLTRDGVIARQKELIEKVCDFLGISPSNSRALLQSCCWDAEKVFTQWTEDSSRLCKRIGIDPAAGTQTVKGKKMKGECLVCFEETDLYQLSCGHGYCSSCWAGYLKVHIQERKAGIRCPAPKCGRVLDEMIVLQLAGDDELRKKFDDSLVSSFVENNPLVRWCPAPNCGLAILLREVHSERNESIHCQCGHYFCFRCGEEGHAPAFCDMQKEWKMKNSGGDDALNEKFLATISRPCPSCKNPIEKNGGCNHMSCAKCGFHFCWQCMSKFGSGAKGGSDGYSNHKCNAYYEEDSKLKLDKEDWERFRWYAERFNNHQRSCKFEQEKFRNSDEARHLMQEQTAITWQASQFYADAMAQLVHNRSVLMWSYVFGFFRPIKRPEINKQLFEHRQNEFERHTEILSKWIDNGMEDPADSIKYIAQHRLEIINDTKLCQNSLRSLLDVAANAFEPDHKPKSDIRSSGSIFDSQSRSLKKSAGSKRSGRPQPPTMSDDLVRQREEEDRIRRERHEAELAEQTRRQRERQAARDQAQREEQEHLERAMKESLQTVQPVEDELLSRALAESLRDAEQPAMTEEEREIQEALRLSLLEAQK